MYWASWGVCWINPEFVRCILFPSWSGRRLISTTSYVCIYIYVCVYIYVYIRTFISRIVPVSVYTTVSEPIQQPTAVRYNSCLQWNPMNLRLQQSPISHLQMSDVLPEANCSLSLVAAFCFHSVESVEGFGRSIKNWYLSSWRRLILSYWQNDKKNPMKP